jgi:F0F1-type ATP synthase delta subunit
MRERYITAVLALFREHHDVEAVVRGLREILVKRNHERLLPGILRGVLRRLEDSASGATAQVVVASEAELTKQKSVIAALLATLAVTDAPNITFDDSLIGGVVVSGNYQRIDTSYKRALASLYTRVTE